MSSDVRDLQSLPHLLYRNLWCVYKMLTINQDQKKKKKEETRNNIRNITGFEPDVIKL